MKIFTKSTLALAALMTAASSYAGNLWIIGEATPYGWSLDDMSALQSTEENSDIYTGTIYLKADKEFKFLTTDNWGGLEYGSVEGATWQDNEIALAEGMNDTGYSKLKVSEDANYYITVDTKAMIAKVVKSEYQATEIDFCTLYLVGGATPGGWAMDKGTALYQMVATPYIYERSVDLVAGTFKMLVAEKGGWDAKYWYFRDENDPGKIVRNQEGDLQWDIADAGTYFVKVNTLENTISITLDISSAITVVEELENAPVEYFNLSGYKVTEPSNGIFIRKAGSTIQKVIIR